MLPGIYKAFQYWGNEGAVWIYSDPHFGDCDLKDNISNRPSDEVQIKNINSCAGRKDTLIILGDIGDVSKVSQLHAARKILIMGNHDKGISNYQRKNEFKRYDSEKYTRKEALEDMRKLFPNCKLKLREEYNLSQTPFHFWTIEADNCLFDEIYEGAIIIGEKLILSHEPINIPWLFNIHGHDHNEKSKKDNLHLNVCSDVIGYKPINLNNLLKKGISSKIQSIHRVTINKATERKIKRKKFEYNVIKRDKGENKKWHK